MITSSLVNRAPFKCHSPNVSPRPYWPCRRNQTRRVFSTAHVSRFRWCTGSANMNYLGDSRKCEQQHSMKFLYATWCSRNLKFPTIIWHILLLEVTDPCIRCFKKARGKYSTYKDVHLSNTISLKLKVSYHIFWHNIFTDQWIGC